MDDRDSAGRFVRGLTLGALLGAIVAGSSLWRKARSPRHPDRVSTATDRDDSPVERPRR